MVKNDQWVQLPLIRKRGIIYEMDKNIKIGGKAIFVLLFDTWKNRQTIPLKRFRFYFKTNLHLPAFHFLSAVYNTIKTNPNASIY